MSNLKDEDDDFFADIYGEDKPNTKTESQPKEAAKEAPKSESAPPADPRLAAFLNASKPSTEKTNSSSSPVPSTAAPVAAPAPAAPPAAPSAPAPISAPAASSSAVPPMSFDPSTFSAQLAQLQQLSQMSQQNAGLSTSANDLVPAHQGGGFMAGKIFIPAKDEGKMFIGGLNWETTDESMKNYFSRFGEVTECTVMRDNVSGRSRGFGFLSFKDPKCVTQVLSQEHFLDGKIIDPKRAIPREEQDKTAKIFVGGVSADVTENDFKTFFEQYGTVIDAQLMMDKDTGRPRGFGFVTFDSDQAVETIVAEQFLNLKGKPIEVKRAEPRGREQVHNDGRNGRMAFPMAQQQNAYGNGMDPAMMTQYYQQWQAYMSKMQEMMQGGAAAASPNHPMMQMYQQMMAQQGGGGMPQMPQQQHGNDEGGEREHRRNYRRGGNDERHRSRSPASNGRRRMGRDRDRDRHYNRT